MALAGARHFTVAEFCWKTTLAPQVLADRLSTTTHYDTVQQVQIHGRVPNLSCEGELEQIGDRDVCSKTRSCCELLGESL